MARLKDFYKETVVPKLTKDSGREERHAGPEARQDHGEHGRGRSRGRPQGHGRGGGRSHQDHGPEAQALHVEEVDRVVQGSREPGDRHQGDVARRTHVGVLRSSGDDRDSRIRDFRGINPRSFDGRGNFSLGIKEQIIFPEIQYDQIDQLRGMDITITTTAKDDKQGRALLNAFNFPFRK